MVGADLFAILAAGTPGQAGPAIPLIILAIGIAIVISMIVVLRVNAFLALIVAAMVVSLMSPGPVAERVSRVATAFGTTAGKIGVVIALAAIIGDCLIASGAADRVVRMFVRLLGEKRCEISLMASGFVLSVPVFFDTVFYLLLPLARSMHRQTRKSYLLLILAMGAGASITHSMVPPTPGPSDHCRNTRHQSGHDDRDRASLFDPDGRHGPVPRPLAGQTNRHPHAGPRRLPDRVGSAAGRQASGPVHVGPAHHSAGGADHHGHGSFLVGKGSRAGFGTQTGRRLSPPCSATPTWR